jgi:predicted nucleic-acid-binding Zn-ribbon protein
MPALPRISWCADKGFLYFDIERKKYYTCFTLLQGVYTEFGTASVLQTVTEVWINGSWNPGLN